MSPVCVDNVLIRFSNTLSHVRDFQQSDNNRDRFAVRKKIFSFVKQTIPECATNSVRCQSRTALWYLSINKSLQS